MQNKNTQKKRKHIKIKISTPEKNSSYIKEIQGYANYNLYPIKIIKDFVNSTEILKKLSEQLKDKFHSPIKIDIKFTGIISEAI